MKSVKKIKEKLLTHLTETVPSDLSISKIAEYAKDGKVSTDKEAE